MIIVPLRYLKKGKKKYKSLTLLLDWSTLKQIKENKMLANSQLII
jgi:hypothetical protein